MARVQKLKVFRTPIGFHDAYVAAPSRKAALAAWGTDRDLFARGVAEQVDDPELTAEPLANPGKIIRRSRGTTAEQIAALPKDRPNARRLDEAPDDDEPAPRGRAKRGTAARKRAPPKPRPKPSRATLDQAERALAEEERRAGDALEALAHRERELAREREQLEAEGERKRTAQQTRVDEERDAYERAMRDWQG
jgi:hypothetical protein